MEMVKVKMQVIKDNVFQGYEIREVGAGIADEQLSLPKEERHPHWKGVEYATDEDLVIHGGEQLKEAPKNKGGRPKSQPITENK